MGVGGPGFASWTGSSSTFSSSSSSSSCCVRSELVSSEAITWIQGSSSIGSCIMGTDGEDVASWADSSLVVSLSSTLSSPCTVSISHAFPSSGAITGGLVGGGSIFCWRKVAKNLGSHCGGRKQKSTTDATSRDSPITPIASRGLFLVTTACSKAWSAVGERRCRCGVDDVGDLSGPQDTIFGDRGYW